MGKCLNCETELAGPYCHACGQDANATRYTIKRFVRDMLDSVIDFDSSFVRTFLVLMRRPGVFIRDYLMGKRHAYMAPLRYFLFIMALNVAASVLLGEPAVNPVSIESSADTLLSHFIGFLNSLVYSIIILIPYSLSLRLINGKSGLVMAEYFCFTVYVAAQSIGLFIVLQVALLPFGAVLRGVSEGLGWTALFTVFYFRSYLSFSSDSLKRKLFTVGVSYVAATVSVVFVMSLVGLVLRELLL